MHVRVERQGRVALLELNRSDRRNAVGPALVDDLEVAARALGADDDVAVIVLAGAGPSFCAGADMKERLGSAEQSAAVFRSVRRASLLVHELPVPVIAAVHGHAIGAGLELAAMCDYRIAEEGTKLGIPEVRQGITSGGGLLALASLVHRGTLARLAFTGQILDAGAAHALGVVDEVVAAGAARNAALALAEEIAQQARAALVATKTALRAAAEPFNAQQWSYLGLLQTTMEGGPAQQAALDGLRRPS